MKFFAIILAAIVLWLSSMPCKGVESAKDATELVKSTQDNQDNQDTHACSPFCTCSCCSGINFKVQHFSIAKVSFGNSSKNPFYIAPAIADISLPVWQPPQIRA